MAKKRIVKTGASGTDEEVILNEEALEGEEVEEETDDEETDESEVEEDGEDSDKEVESEIEEAEAKEATSAPEKEKVRVMRDLNCHIGGKFHSFKANHEYFVSENVKSILKEAGYLGAL